MAASRSDSSLPAPRLGVDASDLGRLDSILALLQTLNDPRASAAKVSRHIAEISVLAARIQQRFVQMKGLPAPRLTEQIALLGNRELEGILLVLLEDIVALHSDLASADTPEDA